jgi:hypothetical protein
MAGDITVAIRLRTEGAGKVTNIFRAAIQTHYQIGRSEQLEGNKGRRPYLMYDGDQRRAHPADASGDGQLRRGDR